jgi:hypothetical protein
MADAYPTLGLSLSPTGCRRLDETSTVAADSQR